jgi:hypothetical protein
MTIRSCTSLLLAVVIGLIGVTQAVGQRLCRPALRINDVQFSPMQPPTLERTCGAVVSVDASQCAADSSGSFEIVFLGLKETAPDFEFRERFRWTPPAVKVNVTFAFDEAVQHYAIDNVSACACRD